MTQLALPVVAIVVVTMSVGGCKGGSVVGNGTSARAMYLSTVRASLQWVKGSDPVREAERAFERKDFRLLVFMAYGPTFLGVTGPEIDEFVHRRGYGVRFIEGTSDIPASSCERELNSLASRYAWRYNQRLVALLKSLMP